MSPSKWDKLVQKYFFLYRDGFFELPYLSNSPQIMIEGLKNTPEAIHNPLAQSIYSDNPFCRGIVRYREIEDGLWILATNIEIKRNIIAKTLYNETEESDCYFLSFSVFDHEFSLSSNVLDKVIVKSIGWTFYKPKTEVSTYFYKDTTGKFCNFIFNKKWAERNSELIEVFKGNLEIQFINSGIGFKSWLDIVPNSYQLFKEIWDILETEEEEPFGNKALKKSILGLISDFFKTVSDLKKPEKLVFLNNKDYSNIAKAEKIILDNLNLPFVGIDKIASDVLLSPTKLKSNFKSVFGLSLLQYHKEKNMLLAMQLLANSGMQIKNIAASIGYESSSKFTAAFKKRFGTLPSEVRNN
jgi:AraC-like DNA-binding protein